MLNTEKQLKLSEFTRIYDLIISKYHIFRKITENIDFSLVS